MKRLCFSLAILVFLFASCTNADPKKMAVAFCDCVQSKKPISSKAKKIILKAARSDDFQTSLEEQIAAIDDQTEKEEVGDDIKNVAMSFQNSKNQQCFADIDKKYRVYKTDQAEMQKKMVDEMENVDDCEVYAAFVRVGMKKLQKKGMNDETNTDDEEEKPTKKHRTVESDE